MPNLLSGHPCELDLGVVGSVIILGSIGIIWIDHKLNVTKMDGSGFVPVLQMQLAEHISALPQVCLLLEPGPILPSRLALTGLRSLVSGTTGRAE